MALAKSLSTAKRLERTNNLDEAAKIYDEILAQYPKNVKARKAHKALAQRRRQASDPPAEIQNKLTRDFAAGQFRTTATSASELIHTFSDSYFLWSLLGHCYLQLGALDKSTSCLTRACDINPDSGESRTLLGNALKQQGKLHDAIAQYTKAIELIPDNLAALNNLGNTLLALGRLSEAAHYQLFLIERHFV